MAIQYSSSISEQAKQYNAMLDFVKTSLTSVASAMTIKQVAETLAGLVKNEQQVRDGLRSMYNKGLITRYAIGNKHYYYALQPKDATENETPTSSAALEPTVELTPADLAEKVQAKPWSPVSPPKSVGGAIPEITIIGNTIVIAHPKCKITLEV